MTTLPHINQYNHIHKFIDAPKMYLIVKQIISKANSFNFWEINRQKLFCCEFGLENKKYN